MSFLGACLSILLAAGAAALGVLLLSRALVSLCPGGWFLDLRRQLFFLTQPFLEPLSGWFALRPGGVDWTALALSLVCFLVAKGLAPWFAYVGFRLSAG